MSGSYVEHRWFRSHIRSSHDRYVDIIHSLH